MEGQGMNKLPFWMHPEIILSEILKIKIVQFQIEMNWAKHCDHTPITFPWSNNTMTSD